MKVTELFEVKKEVDDLDRMMKKHKKSHTEIQVHLDKSDPGQIEGNVWVKGAKSEEEARRIAEDPDAMKKVHAKLARSGLSLDDAEETGNEEDTVPGEEGWLFYYQWH